MFAAAMRRFIVGLLAAATLVWAAPAMAAGSVKLGSSTIDESDGRWKLKFTIDYGSKPHLAHVPMTFSFKKTAIYERLLTDESGDKPIERTRPVPDAEPNNVPVDVGFANSKGEMFQITKFSIELRRDADFEAGEYDLTVKESSGRTIGGKVRIKLRGNNKIINAKSMDFSSSAPKPKPKPDPEPDPEEDGPMASEDRGPDLSDIPDVADDDASDGPGKVKPKQGGCGCELAGAPQDGRWAALALALGAVAVARRRRWVSP